MRPLKIFAIIANIVLILLNLFLIYFFLLVYFDFRIDGFFHYISSSHSIEINENEIDLPAGYYLSSIRENDTGEISYRINSFGLAALDVIYYSDTLHFNEEYKKRFINAQFEMLLNRPESMTYGVNSHYKFMNTDILIYRWTDVLYPLGFMYFYNAIILDRSIQLIVSGRFATMKDCLEAVRTIAFDGEDGAIVAISRR